MSQLALNRIWKAAGCDRLLPGQGLNLGLKSLSYHLLQVVLDRLDVTAMSGGLLRALSRNGKFTMMIMIVVFREAYVKICCLYFLYVVDLVTHCLSTCGSEVIAKNTTSVTFIWSTTLAILAMFQTPPFCLSCTQQEVTELQNVNFYTQSKHFLHFIPKKGVRC